MFVKKFKIKIQVGDMEVPQGFMGEELALECIFRSPDWGGLKSSLEKVCAIHSQRSHSLALVWNN